VSGTQCVAMQQKLSGLSRRGFLSGAWTPQGGVPDAAANGTVAIGPSCLALNRVVCRSCAEHCERHAIRFRLAPGGIAVPVLRIERCDGCGACIPVCPTSAISMRAPDLVNEEAA